MVQNIYWLISFISITILTLSACNTQVEITSPINTITPLTISQTVDLKHSLTPSPSSTPTFTPSPSATNPHTPTATPIDTATTTSTPENTLTPSITPTPTFDFPDVTVNVGSAHCRYGPGKAYLHAADLFEGDHGQVWN